MADGNTSYTIHVEKPLWKRFKDVVPKTYTINDYVTMIIEEKVNILENDSSKDNGAALGTLSARMLEMEKKIAELTGNNKPKRKVEKEVEDPPLDDLEDDACAKCGGQDHTDARSVRCPENARNKKRAEKMAKKNDPKPKPKSKKPAPKPKKDAKPKEKKAKADKVTVPKSKKKLTVPESF